MTLEEFVGDAFEIYTNKFKKLGGELKIDMSIDNFENVIKLFKEPLEDTTDGQNCKICFVSKISCAYIGCGHTACATCAGNIKNYKGYGDGNCPFCRKCSKTIQIYL